MNLFIFSALIMDQFINHKYFEDFKDKANCVYYYFFFRFNSRPINKYLNVIRRFKKGEICNMFSFFRFNNGPINK